MNIKDIKIGDKFTFTEEAVAKSLAYTKYYNKDGFMLDIKTVCEVTNLSVSNGLIYFDGLYDGSGNKNDLPTTIDFIALCDSASAIDNSPKACTCNNFDLFNMGCKCGWIQIERNSK